MFSESAGKLQFDLQKFKQFLNTATYFNKVVDQQIKYDNTKFKQLKLLGIELQQLNYYFSNQQFTVHVDELSKGLWNLFKQFYSNETLMNFLIMLNTEIRCSDDFSKSDLLAKYAQVNEANVAPIVMYRASYLFNHKFQKINKIVERYLKNKYFNQQV